MSVENGVVDLSGQVYRDWIPQLLDEIREIEDVTEVVDHLAAV